MLYCYTAQSSTQQTYISMVVSACVCVVSPVLVFVVLVSVVDGATVVVIIAVLGNLSNISTGN